MYMYGAKKTFICPKTLQNAKSTYKLSYGQSLPNRAVHFLLITCLLGVLVESTNDDRTGRLIEYKGISGLHNS